MSNAVDIYSGPHDEYQPVGAAGIWNEMPPYFHKAFAAMDLLDNVVVPEDEEAELALTDREYAALDVLTEFERIPPRPYLQLLHKQGPPTRDKPAYLFLAALTVRPDDPFVPVDDQAESDGLQFTVEVNRVIVGDTPVSHDPTLYDPISEEQSPAPTKTIRALLNKDVQPIGFRRPIIEALSRFVERCGVTWDPKSLTTITGMDENFYHFETVVPDTDVTLTIGDKAHAVAVSALVAAGLRTAICETVRIASVAPLAEALQQDPELLDRFLRASLEVGGGALGPVLARAQQLPELEA